MSGVDSVTGLTEAEAHALDACPDTLDTPGRVSRGDATGTRAAAAMATVLDYVDVPDHRFEALFDALAAALPEDPPHSVRVTLGRRALLRLTREAAAARVSREEYIRRRLGVE